MATLITDPLLETRLLAERKVSGADRYDEVWEGVYRMAPMPNNEHQDLVGRFTHILQELLGDPTRGRVLPGTNVSDRDHDWTHNYRVPDVAVFLAGTTAVDCGTHWRGGPDLLVEILSPDDSAREKLAFYERVAVREVLLIDRNPWAMELYRLSGGQLQLAGRLTPGDSASFACQVLPLTLRFCNEYDHRPAIQASHSTTGQTWLI